MVFDDGLNVIIGASDQGKSAVIRALRWVLYNEPRGSDFIRVGASTARVTIELNDGYRVTRERTPSKNRYLVITPTGEEQVYEGFGNGVPLEVIQAHGVEKMTLDEGEEKMLHLGMQLDGPFLLSESGAVKTKAIGRLNGVHIIDAAQRDVSRELTQLQQEEKSTQEQLAAYQEELAQFDDLAYMENILLLVEEKQKQVERCSHRLAKLSQWREDYRRVESELAALERILQLTEHLQEAALRLERLQHLEERLRRLLRWRERLQRLQGEVEQCDTVLAATMPLAEAESLWERLRQTKEKRDRLQQLAQLWRDLAAAGQHLQRMLRETQGVARGQELMEQLQQRVQRLNHLRVQREKLHQTERLLSGLHQLLARLDVLPAAQEKWLRLEDKVQRWQRLLSMQQKKLDLEQRLAKADQFLQAHAREMEKQLRTYQALLRQAGTCPLCFSPIDEHAMERILAELKGGIEDGRDGI